MAAIQYLNPDILTRRENYATAGREWLFLVKDDTKWTRFGLIESSEPGGEVTRLPLTGNVDGTQQEYANRISAETKSFTIQTPSYTDRHIVRLWNGGTYIVGRTAETWAATTAVVVGDRIAPTVDNGHYYVVTTAGNTGATEPDWTTDAGGIVNDGTAVLAEDGPYEDGIIGGEDRVRDVEGAAIYIQRDKNSNFVFIKGFPRAQFSPNPADVEIQSYTGREGTINILADDDFVPPAALLDFQGKATPLGVWYQVGNRYLDTVRDALATALQTNLNGA